MQGKSEHPKTQFSAPSLGDGLEIKEIIFLRKKKKPLMALDKEIPHVGGIPSRFCWRSPLGGSSVTVLRNHSQGWGCSGARVIMELAEIAGKKVSGELPACVVGSSGGKINQNTTPKHAFIREPSPGNAGPGCAKPGCNATFQVWMKAMG